MQILLVNPPFYGASGPYPATCYLKGFLETLGVEASQYDANIEVLLRLFSSAGLRRLHDDISAQVLAGWSPPPIIQRFVEHLPEYERSIDTAILALQGNDQGAIARVLRPGFCPPPLDPGKSWIRSTQVAIHTLQEVLGPLTPAQVEKAGEAGDVLRFAFGKSGETDRARFMASCLLADVMIVLQHVADADFQFDEYLKELTADADTFEPLAGRLEGRPNLIDRTIDDVAIELFQTMKPDVVGLSVPFGGNLYGALRIARAIKQVGPATRTIMGGGYVNTVLRSLSDPGIFDYIDYITLDDGEAPLRCILEMLQGQRSEHDLLRTFRREHGKVVYVSSPHVHDVPSSLTGFPTYEGLPLKKYLAYWPSLATRQTIWARRWNKLTLAHGCYWRKCAFCDTRLDYVGRYDPSSLDITIARMRHLIDETGETGFHFVDEALPPALLRKLAERLLEEDLDVTWWGNARFDKTFASMAPLLARSGCVAITGGLETPSDRLLKLMDKGVSLRQVAQVTHALSAAGIFVHAYLIYGFPTQTRQETMDALELVRQMFTENCIQSAVWARFFLTEFSPIAAAPDQFGITVTTRRKNPFGNSTLDYVEQGGLNHGQFTNGLRKALTQYLQGFGWDRPVQDWFDPHVGQPTTLPGDYVKTALLALPTP